MDKMIYTVAQGANRILMSQSMRANNLANANTTGFKADLERVVAKPVDTNADSLPSRVMPEMEGNGFSHKQGQMNQTGRDLDVAIKGDGLLAVIGPDGQESYTRNGALVIDSAGELSVNGMKVVGDGGPIVIPTYEKLHVGKDGSVTATTNSGSTTQNIGRLKLVNFDINAVAKGTDGLFHSLTGAVLPEDQNVQVESGALEESNVNAVGELLACMDLSRQFEIQIKLMKKADEMAQAGNRLLNA